MEKAQSFEHYFSDPNLKPEQISQMQLVRSIVHELYPEVVEKVSYAMPGFFPKGATKANQQLLMVMANKGWLGLYGTFGITDADLDDFLDSGISASKGSIHVPYDLPEESLKRLLKLVIDYNLGRFNQTST